MCIGWIGVIIHHTISSIRHLSAAPDFEIRQSSQHLDQQPAEANGAQRMRYFVYLCLVHFAQWGCKVLLPFVVLLFMFV